VYARICEGITMRTERKPKYFLIYEDTSIDENQTCTRFYLSIERMLERLCEESEKKGWAYSQFVSATLEVLTILHHRDKLKLAARQTPKAIPHRKHAIR
jgi:hypothetical protein